MFPKAPSGGRKEHMAPAKHTRQSVSLWGGGHQQWAFPKGRDIGSQFWEQVGIFAFGLEGQAILKHYFSTTFNKMLDLLENMSSSMDFWGVWLPFKCFSRLPNLPEGLGAPGGGRDQLHTDSFRGSHDEVLCAGFAT